MRASKRETLFALCTALGVVVLSACAAKPVRYDLPPPSRAAETVVTVRVNGSVDVELPHNALEGFAGGSLAGARVGLEPACWPLLCFPVTVTVGAVAGIATSTAPWNIDRVDRALEAQDLRHVVVPRLVAAVVARGNALGSFKFVAAADSPNLEAAVPDLYSGGSRETSPVPRIDLFIDDIHAGINGFGEFVLTVKGRLDTREFGPLNHASAKEHLDHWIGNQSAQHIDAALNAASDSIADQLIRAVFVQNESPR